MKRISVYISTMVLGIAVLSGCIKSLDKQPPNTLPSSNVYTTESGYLQVLAKVYGSMALTGQVGPAGTDESKDIKGIDEGTSDFLRLFWKAQELSTDEAVVAWNDPGIQDFHNMNWSSSNPMLKGLYYRCTFVVTLCNEFIRESAPDKVSSRGLSADNIKKMRAEARFIRAYANWVLMDLFANPSFTTEEDQIGKFNPPQTNRTQLFSYIESELKAIEGDLSAPRSGDYGRADKAAAWSLLARMYLNAKVYVGTDKYTDAVTYSKKVIDAGYGLLSNYTWLGLADNNVSNPEFILTLNYDGIHTKNYGGTTFLVNASVGGDMDKNVSGLGAWGGIRATKNLPNLFPDVNGTGDKRAQFAAGSQNLEINNISDFKDGLAVIKYRNRTRSGGFGQDPDKTFSDIDYPLFRLAEMYLTYAEAVKRGGAGGSDAQAVIYLNALRSRAQVVAGNIGSYTLDYILDERARELYWEGFRRTDLIRYDRFVEGTYLWPWKGGVKNGAGVAATRKIYPIPDSEIAANPNLTQNAGY